MGRRRKLEGGEEGGNVGKGKDERGEEEVDLYKDWPCTNEAHDVVILFPPAVGFSLPGWCTLPPSNPLGLPQPPPSVPCGGDVDWSLSSLCNQPCSCGHSLCSHRSLSLHHQQHRRDPKPARPSTRNCNRSPVCATDTVPGAVCIGSCSVHSHLCLTEAQSLSTQAQASSKKKHKRPCERGKPTHSEHRHRQQF